MAVSGARLVGGKHTLNEVLGWILAETVHLLQLIIYHPAHVLVGMLQPANM